MLADANRYAKQYGDPQFATGQYTEHLFKPFNDQSLCGGEPGWNGEETLDVESVHAMATGANVLYVGAQNCDAGLDSAINWVIQNNAASIVSNSWGSQGEDGLGSSYALESSLFVQAKAEGIGFYFSSGDDGDNALIGNTATPEPDYPSSDANVTAVGGTSLAVDSRGNYQFETSWGSYIDDIDYSGTKAVYSEPLPGEFWHGTGGGTSTLVSQPDYQAAVVPSRLSAPQGGAPMRVVPDVAANADPFTGFNVGQTINGVWEVEAWGGTSLACPVFAGIQALASQGRTTPIGFANPMIYKAPATAFHDVKAPASQIAIVSPDAGFLVPFALDSSLDASRNYDDATGRGSPIAPSFIAAEGKPSPVGSPGPWPRSQFKAI
jgi:subtilase family serine protease